MTVTFNTSSMHCTVVNTVLYITVQSLIPSITLAMTIHTSSLIITIINTLLSFTSLPTIASIALTKGYLIVRPNADSKSTAVPRTVLERTVSTIIASVTSAGIGISVTNAFERTIVETSPL
jgi:flagellar biosynthesis protein FliP